MLDINISQSFIEMKDFFITQKIAFEVNILSGLFLSLIGVIIWFFSFKKFEKKVNQVEMQTYISGQVSHIVCPNDNYTVEQIPSILLNYRKKLKTTDDEEEVNFWNTRVSTIIVFTDGNKILLYDRTKNRNKELFHNPELDIYGAVKFHNPSLKFKLPSSFMKTKILSLESIPGIVIEQNTNFYKFKLNKSETAIMIGFIAYIDSKDLEKGLDEDLDNKIKSEDNKLISISCLSPDNDNLTAKAKFAIRYLQSLDFVNSKSNNKCEINKGVKPFTFSELEKSKRDNLMELKGIGNVTNKTLNDIGVFTFKQISEWTEENIEWIDNYLFSLGYVKRKKWVEQAKNKLKKEVDNA